MLVDWYQPFNMAWSPFFMHCQRCGCAVMPLEVRSRRWKETERERKRERVRGLRRKGSEEAGEWLRAVLIRGEKRTKSKKQREKK